MKISICVSTYNQEKYILDCLESIEMQVVNASLEIIIGVDLSTDKTLEIVRDFAYKSRHEVIVITSIEQVGASENYLRIHRRASGEYVCHIDGDDLMSESKLTKQVNILELNPLISAVWHNMVLFNDFGEIINPRYASVWEGEITISDFIRVGFVSAHSSIMYRRSARKVYKYDYAVPDYTIFLELLNHGNGYVINESLGQYRNNAVAGEINTNLTAFKHSLYRGLHEFQSNNKKYRKDIFCFSILNLLSDIKSKRKVDKLLISLLIKNISLINPYMLIHTYKKMRLASFRRH